MRTRAASTAASGRRPRFSLGADALPRNSFQPLRRPPARHGVHAVRRVAAHQFQPRTTTTQLLFSYCAQSAGRRQALRPIVGRRRKSDRRPAQPDDRFVLRASVEAGSRASSTTPRFTFSYNGQREERVNQGGQGNPVGSHHQSARAHQRLGFQLLSSTSNSAIATRFCFGADVYRDQD